MTNLRLMYPTTVRTITAGYPNYSSGAYHGGIDFACPLNTIVRASADGEVVISKDLKNSDGTYRSYGRYIAIKHAGNLTTYYCHLNERSVKVGQLVTQGQIIGKTGSTGNSTGPHLHFEVRDGRGNRVNPLDYLDKDIKITTAEEVEEEKYNLTVNIENYSGIGYSKVGEGFYNVYTTPELNYSLFTTRKNEQFSYLGKVVDKDIWYVKFNKGGNAEAIGFLEGKYCYGSPKRIGGIKTIKVTKGTINAEEILG